MFYTLVLQFYKRMVKRKKEDDTLLWKKRIRKIKQCYDNDISRWQRDFFSVKLKEKSKKDLMNLIETNHQINMTSDHSVSSYNSFKIHLNA